jgi:hypothetical protein
MPGGRLERAGACHSDTRHPQAPGRRCLAERDEDKDAMPVALVVVIVAESQGCPEKRQGRCSDGSGCGCLDKRSPIDALTHSAHLQYS